MNGDLRLEIDTHARIEISHVIMLYSSDCMQIQLFSD